MKKRMQALCLGILLLCSGCESMARSEAATVPETELKKAESEVVIFYEGSDSKMERVVSYIREKMNGSSYSISEREQILQNLEQTDLIFVGGMETEEGLSEEMEKFLRQVDFQGKKVAPFWLTTNWQEEFPYERELAAMIPFATVTPGIGIPWEEAQEKEELGRIDGWLTTACTWGEKRTY